MARKRSVCKCTKLQDENLSLNCPCQLLSMQLHPTLCWGKAWPPGSQWSNRFGSEPSSRHLQQNLRGANEMLRLKPLICHPSAVKRSTSISKAKLLTQYKGLTKNTFWFSVVMLGCMLHLLPNPSNWKRQRFHYNSRYTRAHTVFCSKCCQCWLV